MPPCVALCMPSANKIHAENFNSYRFLRRAFVKWYHLGVVGFPVEMARNQLTLQALQIVDSEGKPEVTHLLWIDDDMVYPPDALEKLLAHDLPFVGGLCHDRRHPFKPVLARTLDGATWGVDGDSYGWLYDYPKKQLVPVDATGGAFLLVRREVFEKIRDDECREGLKAGLALRGETLNDEQFEARLHAQKATYGGWWASDDRRGLSEDIAFCARARKAGFPISVDTSLDIGHMGEVVINEDFAQRNRVFEHSQWSPPREALKEMQVKLDKPVATIVITAFNPEPKFLIAAINSALGQTVPCEVIVVDDGSEKPVQNILDAAGLDVTVVQHLTNRGIAAALNSGIERMTTEWFCWLPCDDLFEPAKVEFQLAALLASDRKVGYHGFNGKLDNQNRIGHVNMLVWASMEEQHKLLVTGCAINGTTVMIHRSVFDAVGRFDTSYKYAQDWEMWCRIDRGGFLFHGMPDKLASRREFGNLTARIAAMSPENPERQRRDMENARVSRMYNTRLCACCGEVIP
ncbi:MAG: glycosyltransferase [Candidatus Omnitrophica bacterium]|nr:glycosyltransferase [Candidatus Omnitrophota bacterium]